MPKITHRSASVCIGLVIAALAGSAGSAPSPPSSPGDVPVLPDGWTTEEVRIPTTLGTIAGTLTRPQDASTKVPVALIIGGSGPTDRDGNSAADPAKWNTLLAVANWLAADGVATLRTDKPGSGATGAGNLTVATAAKVTVDDFLTMNAQELAFLAGRPGVDTDRISVVGHSEGGLFAVLLATGQHGAASDVPAVHSIAALEPQSLPILDIISAEVTAQVQQAEDSGQLGEEQGDALLGFLGRAITALRSDTPFPTDLPRELAGLFTPTALTYLRTDDAVDPVCVARRLPAGIAVLTSCSDADIQVSCGDVQQLSEAATAAGADVTPVHLTDVAHTLKVDPSRSPARYGADLPFSPQLRQAVSVWTQQW